MSDEKTSILAPASVHFSLRSPTAEMGQIVLSLHREAKRLFDCVGPPVNLIGEDCAVQYRDPLVGLKVHARGFLVAPGGAFSVLPQEINAFTIRLPNGLPFHIGLCRYPEQVEVQGKVLPVKSIGAQWMSFFRSVKLEQDKPGVCVEGHIKALMLLRHAEKMGVLLSISDPYKQWFSPDSSVFDQICDEQQNLSCSH